MSKKAKPAAKYVKPDLKHDTLEYAAPNEGEDKQDNDDPNREDDAITAEELDFIEADSPDAQAAALNSVEIDRQVGNEVIFDEEDIDEANDIDNEQEETEIR